MRADELHGKRIAIWGYGREGRAATGAYNTVGFRIVMQPTENP